MTRYLPVLLVIAAIIYTAVYVVQSNSEKVRSLPKTLWLALVLVVPVIGALAWWIFGRPLAGAHHPPAAPDDDPDFLRRI